MVTSDETHTESLWQSRGRDSGRWERVRSDCVVGCAVTRKRTRSLLVARLAHPAEKSDHEAKPGPPQ